MDEYKLKLNHKFDLNIVNDNEDRITPQTATITLCDYHLKIKFSRHRNKKIDYLSVYKWFNNEDGSMFMLQYKSRKSDNFRFLTFISERNITNKLADQLLDHCKFIVDTRRDNLG